ncbi:hypothetical protein CEXT_23331 [Caerostris extrusa]|uniref:Uncharacterized protein n=1 Tax=Caerostris extrusa TaxID=172846 RepID=A0AAV4XTJ7_CAEEX|nr:hypothetical protein CEXT_23331 [Caerostris extrusa]
MHNVEKGRANHLVMKLFSWENNRKNSFPNMEVVSGGGKPEQWHPERFADCPALHFGWGYALLVMQGDRAEINKQSRTVAAPRETSSENAYPTNLLG